MKKKKEKVHLIDSRYLPFSIPTNMADGGGSDTDKESERERGRRSDFGGACLCSDRA